MCGITGFFCREQFPDHRRDLPHATAALSHRGPDDSGYFYEPSAGVGLGHRRLSIIDLSASGHQPMQSREDGAVIVFNGEIYNFQSLRSQLQSLGCRFFSSSDTEVILKAYRQWGPACLDRFVGMFAFAIWDPIQRRLFLARDRMGIKPLYYYHDGHSFIFGSEVKALMAFSAFRRQVDPEAFQLYLHYQYVPGPRTIFERTFKLQPGHYMWYDGQDLELKQWWRIPEIEDPLPAPLTGDEREWLARLDRLLTQAVADRLISDVPLGALLSGGIDSSAVVALMQKITPVPVKTFSIGFEEQAYNEAPWARSVARHLGTDHTELTVTSQDALRVVPCLADLYDEPFGDSSAIPTFLVSQLTRQKVTVALSGDGGDEQFAGYVRYWATERMAAGLKRVPQAAIRLLASNLKKVPVGKAAQLYGVFRRCLPHPLRVENFPDKWQKLVEQMGAEDLVDLYRATISIWSRGEARELTGNGLPISTFEASFDATSHHHPLQSLMQVDQRTYLPDAMLTKVDRASMAASLEVRVPLLDHRVVEFTAQLPVGFKFKNGRGKYLLTELVCQYIPRQLVQRPKMGFGVPIAHWLKRDLKPMVMDYLSPAHLQREGRLSRTVVERVLSEHMTGKVNHQHRLWSLLMWELWRNRWLP